MRPWEVTHGRKLSAYLSGLGPRAIRFRPNPGLGTILDYLRARIHRDSRRLSGDCTEKDSGPAPCSTGKPTITGEPHRTTPCCARTRAVPAHAGPRSNWINDVLGQSFCAVSPPIDHGLLEAFKSDIVSRLLKEIPGQPSAAELEADRYRALCDPVRPRRVQPGILQGDVADPPHRPRNRTGRHHAAHILRILRTPAPRSKYAQYGLPGMQLPACAHRGQTSNIPAGAEEREKGPPTKMLGDAPLVKPAGDPRHASSRVDRAIRRWIDLSARDTRARRGSDRGRQPAPGSSAYRRARSSDFGDRSARNGYRFSNSARIRARSIIASRLRSAAQAPGSALAGGRDD